VTAAALSVIVVLGRSEIAVVELRAAVGVVRGG
jgi:hypothetical protein